MERIIDISYRHGLAHLSSCLTMYPILESIYRTKDLKDIVVLSAGHAGVAQYVALEKFEGHSAEKLVEDFGVHPSRDPSRGIHVSSGSLGSAVLVAVGLAMADPSRRIFCLLSDGECAEGTVWEALAFVKSRGIRNLIPHVNINGYGAYDAIDREDLATRLKAFCHWTVIHQTQNPEAPHMRGLEGHYHIIKTQEESNILVSAIHNR
jgi:transketolase N-terminal domain/subunit